MSEEKEASDSGAASNEDVFSLDDLDDMLDGEEGAEKETAEPEVTSEPEEVIEEATPSETEEEETPKQTTREKFPKIFKVLDKISRPFQFVWKPFDRILTVIGVRVARVSSTFTKIFKKIVIYLKTEFPSKIKFYKSKLIGFARKLLDLLISVKSLQRKQQIAIVGLIVLGILMLMLTKQLVTQHIWIPKIVSTDLKNLEAVADHVEIFSPKEDLVFLYNSFSQPHFTFLLEGIVVNLRRSVHSSRLPMARIELYLNLDSSDTAVEVKHRRLEIKDFVSRILEQVSYDDLLSNYGKKKLKISIKTKINEILNQGRVREIYFKEIVYKR